MKLDAEYFRDLGENTTNITNAWAGARDYVSRGVKAWARQQFGADRQMAVRAAIACCELVLGEYEQDHPELPPKSYLDDMVAHIKRWLADPSRENTEAVRSALNVTRDAHAWQREEDAESYWILEAVDHACLAVWSGSRASYIVPIDYATTAARSIACTLHAMRDAGVPEDVACDRIVQAVRAVIA
ncbi:MAG TPA: hypothetical protein VFQ53_17225 [Kofleriaceae bacterium]|nr:hypothetical protein [Kofleriaceae bacterium]